ncbi:hypothetical protein TWF481_003924 [Arthrobotrys musiformis]|uniref:Uncharacterized protein n=1 Tax=Arthrobotrys musiformis TaxID=47236 RepID=A0AAV9WI36_9PEZI
MSQPSTTTDPDPIPERADIPIEHLSFLGHKRGLSPEIGLALSQRAAVNAEASGSGDGTGVSRPAAAVIRRDKAATASPAAEYIASIERGPFSGIMDESLPRSPPQNPKIEPFTREHLYEPSRWDKITESFNTIPYTAKISIYETLKNTWNLPENIVRAKRRLLAPPKPKPQTLPDPVTVGSLPAHLAPRAPKKPTRIGKVLRVFFSPKAWQVYGFLATLALNGGFGYWVWVHVHVYLDPHTWRLRHLVTSSSSTWTAFTSLEIWIAIMLGIWNIGGGYLLIAGPVILLELLMKYSGLLWLLLQSRMLRRKRPNPDPDDGGAAVKPKNGPMGACMGTFWGLYFLILVIWPILASTIPAPRLRVDRYPKRCGGGAWDFRVILDGRVRPKNLTMGRVTIRELNGENVGREAVYITENYVDTTWMRTEEQVVLRRATIPADGETVYVSEVTYRFPYMETDWEKAGWKSLPDVTRDRGGNYTVILTDSDTGRNETINGRFPYLDDQSGLRLDEMGLIPDVKRSWRSIALTADTCPWGPDAKLLENTDVTARNIVGEGHPVLLTDMSKFGRCGELTVCANRRRQVVDGLPWAVGEEGKKVLDAMLVVPLGLILVEQIRWGSCCGDGFAPYTAGPEQISP